MKHKELFKKAWHVCVWLGFVAFSYGFFELAFATFGVQHLEFWRVVVGLLALSLSRRMFWVACHRWVVLNG